MPMVETLKMFNNLIVLVLKCERDFYIKYVVEKENGNGFVCLHEVELVLNGCKIENKTDLL